MGQGGSQAAGIVSDGARQVQLNADQTPVSKPRGWNSNEGMI
jgi:hypothetical protein